jgi:hypothetical protein
LLKLAEQGEAQYLVPVEVAEAELEVRLVVLAANREIMALVAAEQAVVPTQLELLGQITLSAVVMEAAEAGLVHRLEQAAREEFLAAAVAVGLVQVTAARHLVVTAAQGVVLK